MVLSSEIRGFIKQTLHIVSDDGLECVPLTGGRSGAEVYRIKVKSQRERLSKYYIVKVFNAVKSIGDAETAKAHLLHQCAPDFREHLVKIVDEDKIGEQHVIIYDQANDSVIDTIPFSGLDANSMAQQIEHVAYDLLNVMNKNYRTDGTAVDFFDCLLEKQLGENGRFAKRVGNLLDKPSSICVALNGVIYPNPLHFIKNIHVWSKSLSLPLFIKGVVHGDLHWDNILAARNTYSIIDYDSVSVDSYIFFDHAYFEFSVFYDNSKDNDLKGWSDLLKRLITPSFFETVELCETYVECKVRNAVCQGIRSWVEDKKLEGRRDDIEIQFIMARISAAINFLSKKTCADTGKQVKVLFYIAHCFKLLLSKTNYDYDKNDISGLSVSTELNNVEDIWDGFIKFINYIPVLVTDDKYTPQDSDKLKNICGIDWAMIVDISDEHTDSVVYKLFLDNFKKRSIKKSNISAGEEPETFESTLNVLSIRRATDNNYSGLWRKYGKFSIAALRKLSSENPQVPLMIVFDCSKDSLSFRNQLVNSLCDIKLPGGTRFVSLHSGFSAELKHEIKDLEMTYRWRFVELLGVTLIQVAQACEIYLGEENSTERYANLPSLDGVHKFSEQDLISFESSIELVYYGCEHSKKTSTGITGLDMSGGGDSLGEQFYRGDEASWNDILNHRDFPLLKKKEYDKQMEKILVIVEDNSPRVKTIVLHHGAGTGGTTLSKRILWDLKERIPCARLKKYSSKTAEIILEIYQKTGKCVFLAVESGSTVATEEELYKLKKDVDAHNGKLTIMLIKRTDNDESSDQNKDKNIIMKPLLDTMHIDIAENFVETFSAYAAPKENGEERIGWLRKITTQNDFKDQRSPFFYGFYTFQEEYNLLGNLKRTVFDCSSQEKALLSSLALITVFSQNVCIGFSELRTMMNIGSTDDSVNIYIILEKLPSALSKLTVFRENGLRLCHKVIAERILLLIHNPDNKSIDVVFQAAIDYIQALGNIYDSNDEHVDAVLKELIIDRAYIDAEERKTRFSSLVERIPAWTDRKKLFEFLIGEFPENPHYYNHLARLLAFGDMKNDISPRYKEAVKNAKTAIDVATDGDFPVSTHQTTLGCIYGQWILSDIKAETKNKKRGLLSYNYNELIDSFILRYGLAKSIFEDARQNADMHDSFSYFPQINLECEIISHLIQFDQERNCKQLNEQVPEFSQWYDEHFSTATELLLDMENHSRGDTSLLKEAKNKIKFISQDSMSNVNNQLTSLLASDKPVDKRRRRSIVYSTFALSGCRWNEMEQETLRLSEQCFRKNLSDRDENHIKSDIETWFELYRRVKYFEASEAQSIIADYMEDGYRKEYILFLMAFLMHEKGDASTEIVSRHVSKANRLARLKGLNTLREYDCYVDEKHTVTGCSIVSSINIPRSEVGEPKGLKEFKGKVTEVEQTHGKILLDILNLDVTFIPNPSSIEKDDTTRTFTREDIGCMVSLNLMFSYSGLRGWNVLKIQ